MEDSRRANKRCAHCQDAYVAGVRTGVADGKAQRESLRASLTDALDLIDHLIKKVPWGKTAGVDFLRLNEVPIKGRRVLEATKGGSE